ncbi:MAG: zinc ribbon domain-containing protein [Defluviitaleaceae bacterium]|nr:zinc ribbon domain-containing protein [Defluviitaleaceae bacterium]
MFCQKCGTALDANAAVCTNCSAKTQGAKFCQKCGETMPGDATVCGSCNTRSPVATSPVHWISVGLLVVAVIFLGFLGGDPYLEEVNTFDYLTIPVALAGIITAVALIPNRRIVLKIISIVLNAILLLGAFGWVFLT